MKRFLLISLLLLSLLSTTPISGQDEIPVEDIDRYPEVLDRFSEVSIHNITSDWIDYPLPTINTGPNYFHILSISIHDNLDRFFEEDWYRFEISVDLEQTIFDPDDMIFSVEDQTNYSIPLKYEVDRNMRMVLDGRLFTNATVEVELATTITSYYIDPYPFELQSKRYQVSTLPLQTQFVSTGSYSWSPLATTYLLLDHALDPGYTYDLEVQLQIGNIVSSQSSDRIRISMDGYAVSERVQDEINMKFAISYNPIFAIDIYTLSNSLAFEILKVRIIIDLVNPTDSGFELPDTPWYAFIVAMILNSIALSIVVKMKEAERKWSDN